MYTPVQCSLGCYQFPVIVPLKLVLRRFCDMDLGDVSLVEMWQRFSLMMSDLFEGAVAFWCDCSNEDSWEGWKGVE